MKHRTMDREHNRQNQ